MTSYRNAYEKAVRQHQSGNPTEAEHLYRELLTKWTDHAPSLNMLGVLLSQQGRHQEAAELLEKAISHDNSVPSYHNNLGTIYKVLNQHDKALICYIQSLQLKPDYPEALNNRGTLHDLLGEYREAVECYQQALRIRPEFAEALANLGNSLKQLRQYSSAIECFRRAISLKPIAEYHNNLANALTELGRHDEAMLHYEHAMTCNPNYAEARSNLLCYGQYILNTPPDKLRQIAEEVYGRWANQRTGLRQRPALRLLRTASDTTDRPIRVGYVSGDLCCHPVGLFLKDVIASHDLTAVLPFAYSNGSTTDNVTREIQATLQRQHGGMTGWLDVRNLDDSTMAERIRADQIDILVDLAGHTGKNRLSVFALRPAPVQLSWLGYFATTGLDAVDAVILDTWHAPMGTEAQFTERISRMPHNRFCYTPAPYAPAVAPPPASKNGFITFGSFNNTAKLNDGVISAWGQILQAVPDSRLVLKWRTFADVPYRAHIFSLFNTLDIVAERIDLRPFSPHPQMLEEYADIDIALDPFPFCGGYTSCEALWMGIPVITWPQERVVSRQTFSFLANIGLTELASSSEEDYVAKAVELANDLPRLAELHQTIRTRMATSPLCNIQRFTGDIEQAYRDIWQAMTSELRSTPVNTLNEPVQAGAPTPANFQLLSALYDSDRHAELEKQTRRLIERYPGAGQLWKILGLSLTIQGKDALEALNNTIRLIPHDADAHNDLGTAHQKNGHPDQAIESYRCALELRPDFAEAHYNLGNVLRGLDRNNEAVDCYRHALTLNPQLAIAQNNLGNSLKDLGRQEEAISSFQRALEIQPDEAVTHNNLGTALQGLGRFVDAVASFLRATEIQPTFAAAHCNLGIALTALGQLESSILAFRRAYEINPAMAEAHYFEATALKEQGESIAAVASYHRALSIKPDYAAAYNDLGSTLHGFGDVAGALSCYRRALEFSPDFAGVHNNLGVALQESGKLEEAAASCRRALLLKPDYAEAHSNLGNILKELRQFDAALESFQRALTHKPDFAEANCNLGHTLQLIGRFDEAVTGYRRAIELKPDFVIAHNNLGSLFKDLGHFNEALVCFRRALEIDPDYVEAYDNMLFSHNLQVNEPPEIMLVEAQRYGAMVTRKAHPFDTWLNVPDLARPLRIGWVSGDLCIHPVGYFVESVLAALANGYPDALLHIAYPSHYRNDAVTERIKTCCHCWHPAVGLTDEQLARRIREDGIDILIDLSGHTAHNRLPVFARKPAPVQVTWLGYFATTGVAQIDYLIADHWTLPASEEINFTEKIWRLPETRLCFTLPDIEIEVSPLPALSNGHITFGCFNNLAKMNDDVVTLWSRILRVVPGSRLFLKTKQLQDETVRQQVRERYARHGIHGDRLILEGPTPRTDYLTTYHRVDISLDPFPYPGGTTTVEGLWMGVPVLTLAGERFLSRQGLGLMMNAGLPDWVATDTDDYVGRAVSHAGDLPRLAVLRSQLRQQVLASPLCDATRFAQHFAEALRGMWCGWCNFKEKCE